MAYRKKTYGRKKYNYKKKYAKGKGGILTTKFSAMDVAKAAWNGVKFIKGLVNVERHINVDGALQTVDNVGNVIRLNRIGQGDSLGQRTGNSVLLKTLTFRMKVSLRGGQSALFKYIIFVDQQQIADTTPVVSDVLESDVLGGLERDTLGRFKILVNKTINIDATDRQSVFVEDFITFPDGFHQRYNGPSDTDIQKNGLYLLMISDVPGVTSPNTNRNTRLTYYDN